MRRLLLLYLGLSHSCFAGSMRSAEAEGKSLGESEVNQAVKQAKKFKADELMAHDAKPFSPEDARKDIESNGKLSSEAVDFLTSDEVRRNERENKNFHLNELFLKKSEEIAHHADQYRQGHLNENDEIISSVHTCRQSGDPFIMNVERTRHVEVLHQPGEQAKVCLGHEKVVLVKKGGDFNQSTKALRKKYQKDSTIESFEIECLHAHPTPTHYAARITWKHKKNTEGCDKCQMEKVKEDSYQEVKDEWVYDNPDLWNLLQSPDNTIIEQICLDASPTKTINGKEVVRQCWKERISFLYQFPKTKECEILKHHLCEQMGQTCIQQTPFGCALWELSFKCFDQINRQIVQTDPEDLYGFKEYSRSERTKPNRSFAEVAAKLAVFDEAKKELEKSQIFDASTLEIFKGNRMTCSKNVADHLLYDCCFNYSGLAKQIGLSKCSADEISLADMREQGLCHYIGSYEEKVLDLWKSRDEHVYCCFPSKLARIVQEEGRKQLGMDWGKPKEPNCGGFSFDLLAKLDFNKMDLSEIFDQIPNKLPNDFQDKMQAFQNRLQEQIQKEETQLDEKRRNRS